ncbi:MAG TPA: molybdopterin cofactor-binding domain-containing protein [Gemmataceae bacterium]|nr:molybdopterin cofactor-binding domain-containing protein [Gemmataceae bacterium]
MNELSLLDIPCEPERYELYESSPTWDWDRREFFRITGAGLVVALLFHETADAQRPAQGRQRGGGQSMPQEIGAWLHVGEDNLVTVYTGKVEIGQNIRTSLSQVVAEELRIPVTRIRMVMADTALTPFDMGTMGSMTTPRMAVQLRRVAAAARETLLEQAAEQAKVQRSSLTITDGRIVGPQSKPSFEFGEVTKGKKLVKLIGSDAPVTPVDKWSVEGTSVPKVDGRAFVTGAHRYASDVQRPGMLFGKVLRPPSFKATLVSVETKDAEAIPGVTVVHEGEFVGVTAPTEQAAAKALAALHAEWRSTSQPSSAELFDYLKKNPSSGRGGFGGPSGNERGSIEEGRKAADKELKATYTVAYIAHAPLEPRVGVAEWTDGKLTVWTGTQRPFGVRGDLALALKIPAERVHVIVPDMGSGYGGKHTGEAAIEAARLAKAAGKPVKVLWTREEEFTWAYFRPAGVIDVTGAVTKNGMLTAWEFHNYNSGGSAIRTPYEVQNQHVAFHGANSPLRQGSYRALAATANHFARESHMDDLAHVLKMDPLAFRMQNLKDARLRAVLEAAAKHFGWGSAKPAAGHGLGIAGGTEKDSYVATCAEVMADQKTGLLKVLRVVTAFECGAVLNPDHLKNQIEGAAMMGLGGALFEEIRFADGKILNPHFSSYRVPRFRDMPQIEAVLVDRKDLPSKGAGETPIVALAPAVANAIFNATGVRLRSLPMIPNGFKAS